MAPCPAVLIPSSIPDAVRGADIVLAATTSPTPLFDGNDLKPGAHVTGVGAFTPEMQEIDENTVRRATVIVDSREACLAEAGDIIKSKALIDAELGEVVTGKHPGRNSSEEITFFKSVGLAAQDAAAAAAVLGTAEKRGLGTLVEMA
jgi:ornithine cyclodeaminase/alanine dehydrogenase-like protein (mu-crystallin family)